MVWTRAVRSALRCLPSALRPLYKLLRQHDARRNVWTYLGDVYLTVPNANLNHATDTASRCFAALGLEPSEGKTKLWCPDGQFEIPPAVSWKLPCLWIAIAFVRSRSDGVDDWREVAATCQ